MNEAVTTVTEKKPMAKSLIRDYVELTKPRISAMVLITVALAADAATVSGVAQGFGWPLIHAVIGTLLIAASGSAMNQYIERWLDARMKRTSSRPLPGGRLTSNEVVLFGTITFCCGCAYLFATTNPTCLFLGIGTWVLYVWIYTPLKTRTWANTIVGAVAGAMPVLIGWYAVTPVTTSLIVSIFLILFLWQFPHFMAIAWIYRQQYSEGRMLMLPVVDPSGKWAGIEAVFTAIALLPTSLIPLAYLSGIDFYGYLFAAFVLNAWYIFASWKFLQDRNDFTARKLLHASLFYLPLILIALVVALHHDFYK